MMQQSPHYVGWRIMCVEFGLSYKLLESKKLLRHPETVHNTVSYIGLSGRAVLIYLCSSRWQLCASHPGLLQNSRILFIFKVYQVMIFSKFS